MDHIDTTQRRTVLLATDHKNSVLVEVRADMTNHIAYSAYGHQSAQQEVVTQLGFNGELREAQIGWYLLGNGYRAYNPRLMRFHSPDNLSPFGKGGLNTYMYCGGEPVMNSDPTGHFVSALIGQTKNVFTRVFSTTATAARNVANRTASLISSGSAQFSDAFASAKQAVVKATIGLEPFPVPPTRQIKSLATGSPVARPVSISYRPNHPRQQIKIAQQTKLENSRGQVKKSVGIGAERLGNQPNNGNSYHVFAALDGKQSTQIMNMNGNARTVRTAS